MAPAATVDGVVAQNMLLITAGVGDKAALVGSFYNRNGRARHASN